MSGTRSSGRMSFKIVAPVVVRSHLLRNALAPRTRRTDDSVNISEDEAFHESGQSHAPMLFLLAKNCWLPHIFIAITNGRFSVPSIVFKAEK